MERLPHKSPVALVAESDVFRRLVLAARLQRGGFEVLEAADANEAIRLLNSRVVDVVFSNIDLYGEMDGIELAGWLRQHQPNASVVLTHEGRLHLERLLLH